jgi:hypothetical protein
MVRWDKPSKEAETAKAYNSHRPFHLGVARLVQLDWLRNWKSGFHDKGCFAPCRSAMLQSH